MCDCVCVGGEQGVMFLLFDAAQRLARAANNAAEVVNLVCNGVFV